MARLPLNTLPTFCAVARSQNLRAAAAELHLTHSAISQQIRLLEDQLGFTLFDRRGRRIVLNAAGAALLRAAEPALDALDDGVRAAAATAAGAAHHLKVTLLPSFAQRWFLPRLASWREQHPDIGIELDASQRLVDLQREGVHAAIRQGAGHWRGLLSERLTDSPLIALGAPAAARRLMGRPTAALADEPLIGPVDLWERWFALDGYRGPVRTVADFNDAGLMLQATEQDIGITLARELLAADAIREGRLVRLSPLSLQAESAYSYWLVYPPELKDWPPMLALRSWLRSELAKSQRSVKPKAGTSAADRSGSRSRARSA